MFTFVENNIKYLLMITAVIIVIGLIVLFVIVGNKAKMEEKLKELEESDNLLKNENLSDHFFLGHYISGHPEVDFDVENCFGAILDNEELKVFEKKGSTSYKIYKFSLPLKQVKDISLDDASTFEQKVTLGRIALVGVLALAWKKNVKNEAVYLTIHWNDGRFDHHTVFEYAGKYAMTSANTVRNILVKACK